MSEEITETISIKKETKKVEKTRWEKGWDTRRKKKIAEQQKQIEAKDMENSKLKKENRQLKREAKK